MSASKFKGTLLEYVVRRLLLNCGFSPVVPDGLLIFSRSGLTMINGKGAAHDADVLLNPPIQIPFSYPFRLNFECKAYNSKTNLTIIRNALGLRYDINEFEIVTRDQLKERKNNRRTNLAIDNRQRFNYQVGVASIEDFTKPAFEFAANNKIPLLSLRWILPDEICDKFHEITTAYINTLSENRVDGLLAFFRGEDMPSQANFLLNDESVLGEIYRSFIEFEKRVLVGLLESGDMLFLLSETNEATNYFANTQQPLNATFHYRKRELDYWLVHVNREIELGFHLPRNIVAMWKSENYGQQAAIVIKSNMFSKVFIFTKHGEIPFRVINIDKGWLDDIETIG